jgi:hypothetical protein
MVRAAKPADGAIMLAPDTDRLDRLPGRNWPRQDDGGTGRCETLSRSGTAAVRWAGGLRACMGAATTPRQSAACLSFATVLLNLGVRRPRPAHGTRSILELMMAGRWALWSGRKHYLNRMSLGELIVAYFTHHSILT